MNYIQYNILNITIISLTAAFIWVLIGGIFLKRGINAAQMSKAQELKKLEERIKEMGEKSSQTLIFLSFALVVVATLKEKFDISHMIFLNLAMSWWSLALIPILLGILPLKETVESDICWYKCLKWLKFCLLWIAISFILLGAIEFLQAI